MNQGKVLNRELKKRRLLQESLQHSDIQFQQLVASVKDYAIFLMSPEGYIQTWNPGAERIKGYTVEDIIGHHFSIFYLDEAVERGYPEFELEMAVKVGRFEDEGWRVRKDGSQFWANVIISPIWSEDGELKGFSKITRDLTERKLFEEALKQTNAHLEKLVQERTQALEDLNERYRLVIEGTNDGFWDWDVVNDERFWSDKLFQILGLTRPEKPLTSQEATEFVHPDDRQRVIELSQAHFANPDVRYEIEYRLRHSSGRYLHCISRGEAKRDENGNPIRMSGMITDITERKLAEAELMAMQKRLEQSNQDLTHFASIAAHDLQAPLRKVRMFLSMIESDAEEKLSERSIDLLRRTLASVDTMQNLIMDLLAFSRVSKDSPALVEVNLDDVLQEVLQNLHPIVEEKGAIIHAEKLGTVTGDALQLTQVLQNLLENSLKYQPPGQQPVIHIRSENIPGQYSQISIEDNGIGFEQEYEHKIFQPFQRLHGKGSIYQGSGIGLAICKRIVEHHEGTISVNSEKGKGATFTIQFPAGTTNHLVQV